MSNYEKCTCDALPKEVDPEETLPTLDAFRKRMSRAVRDGVPFPKALRGAVRDAFGAGGASTGGSPERTPGPGYEGIQTSEEFQPNAAHTITPFSRASTTAPTLNMGQTWGTREVVENPNVHGFEQTTDADRAYFASNARMQDAIRKMNAHGRQWNDTGECPVSKPMSSTRDQLASDSNGPMRFAGHAVTATAAQINAKNRAHKWGV